MSPIIPQPIQITQTAGSFSVSRGISIPPRPSPGAPEQILAEAMEHLGLPSHDTLAPAIGFHLTPGGQGENEAYALSITPQRITATAAAEAGLIHAAQSLRQLFFHALRQGGGLVPCGEIHDAPRFPWRGMLLDCSRHFLPPAFLFKFVDLLSLYKFNRLHLHLTDDQGWRMEIKRYPQLTQIGAWRPGTRIGHGRSQETPKRFTTDIHGGFYTQSFLCDLVAHAARRGITVMPEIEMPGHASAAIASLPVLGCQQTPLDVVQDWGVFPDLFCAGRDEVLQTLEHILAEVMEVFPSRDIHLGGDECPADRWKDCPFCQDRMRREYLPDETALHAWFLRRMGEFLIRNRRRPVGWDEILEGGSPLAETIVTSWRGEEGAIKAARMGNLAVNASYLSTYFDRYQTETPETEPLAFGGCVTLKKVHDFEPVPAGLEAKFHQNILGAQGQLWTEYMTSPAEVEFMALPRMLALAESVWTDPKHKDWGVFEKKLPLHRQLLRSLNYAQHGC